MSLDLHNIPENADYYSLYWQLNDKYHAALLKIIDLKAALQLIASYDSKDTQFGEGICPYGCDTPHIAQQALLKQPNREECGVEWMDLEFCCLEKGHAGYHKTLSGQLFG